MRRPGSEVASSARPTIVQITAAATMLVAKILIIFIDQPLC
jgi:hypothetical protein